MPFQMPQLQDNIGNALANIGQIRQQRTQNALADRQLGLSEAAGRRQQQQFEAEQAAAQRAQLIDTTKNVLGALSRVPQAQRQAAFQQLAADLPPEFAQRMAGNPEAFTDQNIALALNMFGTLTPDQLFADQRRETQAKTAPKAVVTYGADGKPVERYVDIFGEEAGRGIVQAPDANAGLSAATTRRGQDISASTARRGQDLSYQSTTRGQDMTAATSAAAAARAGPPAAVAAQTAKARSASTAATYYGQARDAFGSLRDTYQAGGPIQTLVGAARAAIHPDERMAAARFDSAIRALTPVLKNVIRGPGEGTWSDGDQAVLESILPNRSMNEMQIEESLKNLETLLRDNGANIPPPRDKGTTPGASVVDWNDL